MLSTPLVPTSDGLSAFRQVVSSFADSLEALTEATQSVQVDPGDVVSWAEDRFFVIETKRPIILEPVQKRVLRAFQERRPDGRFRWRTLLYSTIKKSGKTTVAALYQRWAAEMWGDYGEIYHLGNKLDQAKARAFKITKHSIEEAPSSIKKDWDTGLTTVLTHIPSKSFIQALPVNAAGEAGGNQRLTTWTEFHGYVHDENDKMWSELQPVPTQYLSQRFVESYAGYEGESLLLKNLWDLGLTGERLDDEFPIYGNEIAGLCAYIDTGVEARRMVWQLGEIGAQYYAEQQTTELPHEFDRIHLNDWVSSQNALIDMPEWVALATVTSETVSGYKRLKRPVVVSCDASVSGDCTALVVTGIPKDTESPALELATWIWEPEKGKKLDYNDTLKPALEQVLTTYQVKCVAYDPYQLHDVMTTMQKKYKGITFYEFPQQTERVEADTKLVHRIRHNLVAHTGNLKAGEHVQNADGKKLGDKAIRIVKRRENDPKCKIDFIVAFSMGVHKAFQYAGKPKSASRGQVKTRVQRPVIKH